MSRMLKKYKVFSCTGRREIDVVASSAHCIFHDFSQYLMMRNGVVKQEICMKINVWYIY